MSCRLVVSCTRWGGGAVYLMYVVLVVLLMIDRLLYLLLLLPLTAVCPITTTLRSTGTRMMLIPIKLHTEGQ